MQSTHAETHITYIYYESDLPLERQIYMFISTNKPKCLTYGFFYRVFHIIECDLFHRQLSLTPGLRMMLLRCLVLFLTLLIGQISGYGSGAPSFTCSTKMPSHGAPAQTSPATDYQITTSSSTYTPGGSITGNYQFLYMYYR